MVDVLVSYHLHVLRRVERSQRVVVAGEKNSEKPKKIESQKNGSHFLCWLAMGGSLGCY